VPPFPVYEGFDVLGNEEVVIYSSEPVVSSRRRCFSYWNLHQI